MSVPLSNRLAVLAGYVQEAVHAMRAASREAAERALETGHLLIEAKGECRHGEWLPFLAAAALPERQAQRLMQLARSGLTPETVAEVGVRGALDLAGKRRPPASEAALMVATGALDDTSCGRAFVWESPDHPGHFHVVGAASQFTTLDATRRPVHRDGAAIIFGYVDEILGTQFERVYFEDLAVPVELLENYRQALIVDPPEDDVTEILAEMIAAANQRLKPDTVSDLTARPAR